MPAIETLIPKRLDRLPWSRFHWLVILSLGITWVLDGLEVTLVGAVSGILGSPHTLDLTPAEIGLLASWYIVGAVLGALVFGWATDRFGRRKLFSVTLIIYLCGVILSALSWNFWSFCCFRFITGAGIGGEYSAINSAIDELIPARLRGRVDLIVNGSYWLGAAAGSLSTIFILNPRYLPVNIGWRLGFAVGGVIGLLVLWLRRYVPESPRWLLTHGHADEAEHVTLEIEGRVKAASGCELPAPSGSGLRIEARKDYGFGMIAKAMFQRYRARAFLGLALMISQAFFYNAVFFTYALVLTKFYHVPGEKTGLYLLPFALGNFLGPLVLGHFFDTIGRRAMIAGTYTISALLMGITAVLFSRGAISATQQTALWTVIFFFASPAASSAYLTVSEIFPLETRGLAIAFFFAIGTGIGGVVAPWLFGALIGSGSRVNLLYGYLASAALMLAAAIVEVIVGVKAEGQSLENLAAPLSELQNVTAR
ncbi:MAG TPA: MFS transporter [Verrucomicrobiae bacterium]|nr:MFS transporter [Verrucomicrobiae bacterium]